MSEEEAILGLKLNYFELYNRAGHLKQQISVEDYRKIFETVWDDRAQKAGWNLLITYDRDKCRFNFNRKSA